MKGSVLKKWKRSGLFMNGKPPFNDVGEHYQKHMGGVPNNVDLKKMPKLIRLIGYFMVGFSSIFIILLIIGWLISK